MSEIFSIPNNLSVEKNEVHVFILDTLKYEPFLRTAYESLTLEEKLKAEKFYHKEGYSINVFTRYLLRSLLSRYLRCFRGEIIFSYNKFNKPRIADSINNLDITFNISHSGSVIVIAISKAQDIGVDIEIKKEIKLEDYDKYIFTTRELYHLNSLEKIEFLEAFYKIWTCKEAFSKVVGKGFTLNFKDVEVRISSRTLELTHDLYNLRQFFCANIEYLPYNYVGNLAFSEVKTKLKYFVL
jgi:4'-phosphopantetheinyl transferase